MNSEAVEKRLTSILYVGVLLTVWAIVMAGVQFGVVTSEMPILQRLTHDPLFTIADVAIAMIGVGAVVSAFLALRRSKRSASIARLVVIVAFAYGVCAAIFLSFEALQMGQATAALVNVVFICIAAAIWCALSLRAWRYFQELLGSVRGVSQEQDPNKRRYGC